MLGVASAFTAPYTDELPRERSALPMNDPPAEPVPVAPRATAEPASPLEAFDPAGFATMPDHGRLPRDEDEESLTGVELAAFGVIALGLIGGGWAVSQRNATPRRQRSSHLQR